ncbi:MAG: DUF255 domain-containing protein [Elusimicrobiota bacterium]
MKTEKTPEEKARTKRLNATIMILAGAIMALCGLAGGIIALSGRGDVPDWMFGGGRAAHARTGDWTNAAPKVAFQDWGPEPFTRAKKEGKLVLLFLGPSFNAPTARMAAETFADPAVAALADARLIAVRVRSEGFPDLDRRYRNGGWPTTALLLPDGVMLDAGTSMTPETFRRWAGALADKAASHPEILARADSEAAGSRKAAAADRFRAAPPADAARAEERALAVLSASWDPTRLTFDRRGPRFPRFERISALSRLRATWAQTLAAQAAKGALVFQDPRDGGFLRAANPDGTPAALEKTAADQAAALDALCVLEPESARRELGFLEKNFTPKGAPERWRGWQAGFALDAKRFAASDGPNFERFVTLGWRESGSARLGDDAELSRAVLDCAASSPAMKARSRRVILRAFTDFGKAARTHDPRLLLDDAVALGQALLAAGETAKALEVWRWMERSLAEGPAYLDRVATGILPMEADRIADPALNARALAFTRTLAAALRGDERKNIHLRAEALYAWLSARPEALDPAVWAALAAEEPR